ncbi:HD domain-containing protein [Saccharopolyspora sp. K220]|uniref:phosphonate degradation HD-domain oxygenase n=1 Tax=Saccharopolyspora soli TaxID=2926618 RepID=UPI001F594579|nr:phosphonate degradation HD-domain oxygenase [Saccharopolyspora soli]MCI2419972.1 HD domain-containing protein [Saccharopolyspora soli]
MTTTQRNPIDHLAELFDGAGGKEYLGERVTTATHMLQAGARAEAAGAPDHLVAAALLHDIGHFPGLVSDTDPTADTDDHHDDHGADWLARWFEESVSEPVRMHVAAKRYLCAVEPGYFDKLSETSVHTLRLQGGPMSEQEVRDFEASPHARAAVELRRWDEAAKDPHAPTPDFEHFRPLLESLVNA